MSFPNSNKREVIFEDLGLVDYDKAWDYQEGLFKQTVELKMANRGEGDPENPPKNYLLFCEHPHVFTLGKSGSMDHLISSETQQKETGATFVKTNRGGDITYHGPGQLVGYPIFDLDQFFTDIHLYMRSLEEAVILTLRDYGITGDRIDGLTGVWLDVDSKMPRKICALGVRCSRWVTMHGFAFNVNSDLSYYNQIVPCGISDKDVTSLQRELGHKVPLEEIKVKMKENLANIFDYDYVNSEKSVS